MGNEQDSAIIRAAHARYLAGDKTALEDIYSACRRIARRMIARQIEQKGFTLTDEQADEKAHNAAAYIFEQYKKRATFKMKSPSSYIYLRVLHELYHRRKVDCIVEFVDPQGLAKVPSND